MKKMEAWAGFSLAVHTMGQFDIRKARGAGRVSRERFSKVE